MRRTMGLVIRTADYNDNDRMLTLLTRDFGMMSARVKGAKKQTAKLFGASSLFCCGEYEFYEKNGRFGVRGCAIRCTFGNLRDDYEAFSAACLIADAAGKVAQEECENVKLFALVVQALYALDTGAEPEVVICYFLQRLLYIEGLYPDLTRCALCGGRGAVRFTPQGGVCAACTDGQGVAIDADFAGALADMAGVLPRDMASVQIPQAARGRVSGALIAYLEHVLQMRLKSARFVCAPSERQVR